MTNLNLRLACAAALAFAAYPAFAQDWAHPAIATGLAIPGGPSRAAQAEIPARGRSVVVDAASARLFMIEDGQVVDSMRVVVGKPDSATPMMKSTLYYATLNPYWNVPTDLGRTLIAPNVLKLGTDYLREKGYEVVSAYTSNPRIIDPETVDWRAVAEGKQMVRVRQRPGPANSMGRLKFGFANDDGIFLHDTPRKEVFAEANRSISHGCVRLEYADRLARWLLGHEPPATGTPEDHVALPRPVPIVITYLAEGSPQLAALQ